MIPSQVRQLKGFQYVVQPGDYVSTVCEMFGVPIQRWQELVGANLHKPLAKEAEYGYRHRCFEKLEAGERLNVPASWPGAVSAPRFARVRPRLVMRNPAAGNVGQPMQAGGLELGEAYHGVSIDQLATMISALNQSGIASTIEQTLQVGGVTLPPNVTIDDAIAVVYSWWPYINFPGATPPGATPPLPTPPNPIPSGVDLGTIVSLIKSAIEFLRATSITNGEADVIQKIPWDAIPWNRIPWQTLGTEVLQALARAMSGTPLPAHTTPPIAMPNQQPNFLTADWQNEPWTDMLKDIDWTPGLVEILGDSEAVECIRKNPDRLKKLSTCKQCYDNTEQFKKTLCATEPADPCDCDEPGGGGNGDGGEDTTETASDSDKTALIVGAGVIGVLGIAATAVLLGGRNK
jgi:hypothetical protein